MAQDRSLRSIIAYLLVVVASVLALTYADRHADAKKAAGYDYVAPQAAGGEQAFDGAARSDLERDRAQ